LLKFGALGYIVPSLLLNSYGRCEWPQSFHSQSYKTVRPWRRRNYNFFKNHSYGIVEQF